MAKKSTTAPDMAAKLMGASATTKPDNHTQMSKSSKQGEGTKCLNLNITDTQWRKLKHAALERDTTVSDLVREFIGSL